MGQGYDPRSIIGRYRKLPSGELIEAAYMRTRREFLRSGTGIVQVSLVTLSAWPNNLTAFALAIIAQAMWDQREAAQLPRTASVGLMASQEKMEAQPVAGLKFSLPSLDQDPGKDGTNPTSERRFLLSLSRTAISIHFGLRSKVSLHSCGFVFTGERRVWL